MKEKRPYVLAGNMSVHCARRKCIALSQCWCSCSACRAAKRDHARATVSSRLSEGKGKTLSVCVSFGGLAAQTIKNLLENGLDGPTLELVVEGLALAEVRRRIREDV